jgi:hypothetical protein
MSDGSRLARSASRADAPAAVDFVMTFEAMSPPTSASD